MTERVEMGPPSEGEELPGRPEAPSRSRLSSPWGPLPLWLALLAIVLTFVRFGYAYGISDHDEFIPSVLRLLDPSLYPRDWIVDTISTGINVRTYFLWLVALPSMVLPVWLTTLSLWMVATIGVVYGVHGLSLEILRDRVAAAVATVLATVLTVRFTVGGNSLTYTMLVPEGLAWAIILPGIVFFLRGRLVPAGMLIGLAAWLQILAALHTAVLLCAAALFEVFRRRRSIGDLFRFGIPFVVASLPIALPIGWDQLVSPTADPEGPSTFYINALFRNPFHHLLSAVPLGQLLRFGLIVAAGGTSGILLWRRGQIRHGTTLAVAGVVAIVAILASAYFVEMRPVELVMKLQLQKLSVLLVLGASILLAGAATALAGQRAHALGLRILGHRRVSLAAVAGVGVLLAALAAANVALGDRVQPLRHGETPLGEVERWLERHTPEDALFVIPPSISTFRTRARRSIVANQAAFVFSDGDMQTWFERLMTVAPIDPPPTGFGVRPKLDSAYHARDFEKWLELRDEFGVDYALVDTTRASLPFEAAFTAGRWRVHRLPPSTSAEP